MCIPWLISSYMCLCCCEVGDRENWIWRSSIINIGDVVRKKSDLCLIPRGDSVVFLLVYSFLGVCIVH